MPDVFKNIAVAAGSSSVRRGFADLFSASKAALDEIQAGLGGILPSMPGMPVAKFGDLSIGIDMHPTVTPPSPIMPVPHVGKVYDLMADLMAGMAADFLIWHCAHPAEISYLVGVDQLASRIFNGEEGLHG